MTVTDMGPVVEWLIVLLENGTGRQVGDHQAPADPNLPYCFVHILDGTSFSGPGLHSPDADAAVPIQVDSVGLTAASSRWLADRVRRTLLARDNGAFQVQLEDPPGYKIIDREPAGGPSNPIPEGVTDRIWTTPERFIIHTTPGD